MLRFALHRLFSSFTLVFDISAYIALFVARGCLGNIWATAHFWATLFGSAQEFCKIYTDFEDLAIFQAKSFFFFREKSAMQKTNFTAESGSFMRKTRGYSIVQNEALFNDNLSMSAKGLYALIATRIDYTATPLTKQWLMNHCTEGERAFNRAWDALKVNGYLVAHVHPAEKGRFRYEYELRDSNMDWDGVYLIYYDAQGKISNTNLTRATSNHTPQNVPTGATIPYKTTPVVSAAVVTAAAVM